VEVYEIGRLGRAGTYEAEPLPIEEDEEEPHGQE
jgi:hypothetical protein